MEPATQNLSFGVWLISLSIMSSRFFCVVAGARVSFLFKENNILLCGQTFCLSIIHRWTLGLRPPRLL